MAKEIFVDLHTHTHYSDGLDTPQTLIKASALLGIEALAVTDHDTLVGFPQAQAAGNTWNIRIIPGVEITTEKYHILGLNVDPRNSQLNEFLGTIRDAQRDVCARWVDHIKTTYGFPITMDHVVAAHEIQGPLQDQARFGRMHVLYAIVKNEQNRMHANNTLEDPSTKYIWEHCLKDGKAQVEATAKKATAYDAIQTIHAAGGIAIIAHPFKQIKGDMTQIQADLDILVAEGIDGIEIQPNYGERNEPFKAYAIEHGLKMTYGSDYHGAATRRPLLGRRQGNQVDIEALLKR